MDFLQCKEISENADSGKGSKKRLNEDQLRLLETNFSFNKKLHQDLKYHLSQQLNLPPRQIAIWFQNKRARWKNQTMESDNKAMQLKLDNALAHNRKLEKEVWELRKELDHARVMLRRASPSAPYSSTSGEEDGCCSSFIDTELYACVAGVEQHHQFHDVTGFGAFGPLI